MAADTRINKRYTTGATPQKNAAFRVHFGHKRPDLSAGGAALWSHENDPLLFESLSLQSPASPIFYRKYYAGWLTFRIPTRRDLAVRRHKFMRQTTNS